MISTMLIGCGGGNSGSSGSGSNGNGNGGSGSGGGNGGNTCSLGLNPGFCGTLSGLPSGKTVTLNFSTSDAGSGNLTLNANGSFAYQLGTQVDISTIWNISVSTESSGTSCNVTNQGSNGSGGVRVQEVTGVVVACSPSTTYTVGGTLSGLNNGAQITLKNDGSNGSDVLTLTANGAFTFSNPVNQGGAYSVSVGTQPTNQLCTVAQGAGSNVTANITSVLVTCTNAFPVGGTLTGLNSGAEVTLKDNGGDSLGLTADGAFTFPTPVLQGNPYDVTVSTQPTSQFCSVTGGSGSVSGVVATVQVACITIEQVLYTFAGGPTGGANPRAALVMDTAGNLYGTTTTGGNNLCNGSGCGAVFKLAPNGSGGYTESVLYAFTGGNDGAAPMAGLILDSAGNLYGTTEAGGSDDIGTVFKLAPYGGGYIESVLYTFTGSEDAVPEGALVMDSSGNLYGTATGANISSASGKGGVFKLAPDGSGGYTKSVLYTFTGGSDGASPRAGLIADNAGNFYGVTSAGGNNNCNAGCGAVFKLAPNGSSGYTESVLHTFDGGSDGGTPEGGLIMDSAGDLYGTAAVGGAVNSGTVFELSPNGSGNYTESILYTFNGGITGPDGASPAAGLLMDRAGNLYGTTLSGGIIGYGAVFKLAPNGSGGYAESVLHSFGFGNDGASPQAGLILDSNSRLYGTTVNGGSSPNCNNGCGAVFEVTPY